MQAPESVAHWGEQWLRDWCNQPGLREEEREDRLRRADYWRQLKLDEVLRDWLQLSERAIFNGMTVDELNLNRRVSNELAIYKGTLHALPIWRAFLAYRAEGEPVPEFVLEMFELWAGRLMQLQRDAAADKLTGDEGTAILRAMQFVGDRKSHLSLNRLSGLEERRRKASEMHTLRRLYRTPWKTIARRFGLTEQAVKDLVYEFEPGPRRRRVAVSGSGGSELVAAHRKMVRK